MMSLLMRYFLRLRCCFRNGGGKSSFSVSDYSGTTGNFEPYPYQIEPLDVLSPSNPAEMMCLMCGAQMMKTLLMMILLGYVIDVEPGPVLIVQPTDPDAKSFLRRARCADVARCAVSAWEGPRSEIA